ncbi:hypothetical protein BDM02DRAFT_3182615 [Thelephora ganbajun]|uniref:Uncharacterized protein n=1 Tax=Thelephora ganbajun TaxID=370292 RepID=A0ACB6ZVZ6_THEGA|nr:hypothetical protein BDM02DRAFT_3182615 [Thelephora ganbajun]
MSDNEQNKEQVPKQEDGAAPINIKVLTSSGEEVFFKIKRNTKLSKLQAAYANKVGKDVGTIRFLYDGNRINDDDTPASLEMEDNGQYDPSLPPLISLLLLHADLDSFVGGHTDTIDVMVEQVGGH